jgi:hypothetical protein
MMVPLVLIGNMIFCMGLPRNFPTNDLAGRIPVRSIAGVQLPENWKVILQSNVQYVDQPVKTKLTYEIQLDSTEAVSNIEFEVYLTENVFVQVEEDPSVGFDEVYDYQVTLNGKSLPLNVTEIGSVKYYVMPAFNLTNMNEITKIVESFRYHVSINSINSVKIPWLFNENYAQFIEIKTPRILVQQNGTSDICELVVHFDLPFRQVLVEQSGWMDRFFPSEQVRSADIQKGVLNANIFTYSVAENCTTNGNVFTFDTRFYGNNIASASGVVFIPDWRVALMLMLFLFSPLYVITFSWLGTLTKNEPNRKLGKARVLWTALKAYGVPLTFVPVAIATSTDLLSLLQLVCQIMNPVVLSLVFAYPAIFSAVYYLRKKVYY